MEKSINAVKKEVKLVSKGVQEINVKIIPEIISQTCLDFLFIIDTTGSMEQYIEITKEKLISIMEIIKSE